MGCRGPSLPRRHRVALVRQHRARPHGDRRRGRRADEHLEAYSTFGDFGNRPANELCAELAERAPMAGRARLPRLRRRRRDRHGGQDRPPPLRPARPARAHAPDLAHPGLPRHARLRHLDRRDRGQHVELGPADPEHLERRVRLAARPGGGDPAHRARPRGRVLLRAGDRRRRRLPAARGLHPGRGRPVRRARDPVRGRLRDLRLRPSGHLVRDRALGGRHART